MGTGRERSARCSGWGDGDCDGLGEASAGLGDGRACATAPELQAPTSSTEAAAQATTQLFPINAEVARRAGGTPGMGLHQNRVRSKTINRKGGPRRPAPIAALKGRSVKRETSP